ncbi:hypothetical protein IWZ00DRAFT_102201 [Phyllosticta capitalensis]
MMYSGLVMIFVICCLSSPLRAAATMSLRLPQSLDKTGSHSRHHQSNDSQSHLPGAAPSTWSSSSQPTRQRYKTTVFFLPTCSLQPPLAMAASLPS